MKIDYQEVNSKARTLFEQYPVKILPKGKVLLLPGDKINKAYYIKRGCIREYTNTSQGNEITLHLFMQGSYFPMTSIIADIPNKFYFDAFTNTEVHIIPKQVVLNLFMDEPAVLLELTNRLLQGIDKLLMRIQHTSHDNAYHKTILSILFLARHFGKVRKGERILSQNFTHYEISTIAGLSRETVTREIDKLQEKGLLEYSNSKLVIKDEALLSIELDVWE